MPSSASSVAPEATPTTAAKRILIVDDHPAFREGLKFVIGEDPGFIVCGESDSAAHAIEAYGILQPDIVVLDVSMPGMNGIELIKMILAQSPDLPILVISMHDETLYALRALKAGARGYVMKAEATASILSALHKVAEGKTYVSATFGDQLIFKAIQSLDDGLGSPIDVLSDRELEVFEKLGKGMSTRAIADELHLSPKTVETHRAHIKEKLNFKDGSAMVRFALDWSAHQEADGRPEEER